MSDKAQSDELELTAEVQELASDTIQLPSGDGGSNQNEKAPSKIFTSQQGIKNAKKRLRAFSIQKKMPILPKTIAKSTVTGTTVVIGKLSSTKTTPKVQGPDAESKRLPKPPKPGVKRNNILADSYSDLQKRTLAEIEDMKRKMELVELGIPLGLICPPPNSETAMPTKAMPPIKSFLDPSKVDELISEAKKARAAGKKFKFNYQKLLPDYDNPFQRKREEPKSEEQVDAKKADTYKSHSHSRWDDSHKEKDKDRRKTDRHRDYKKSFDYKKECKDPKDKGKEKDKTEKKMNKELITTNDSREADVNLSDYLVCDSWSLDTEEKTSSPKPDEVSVRNTEKGEVKTRSKDPMDILRDSISASKKKSDQKVDSPIRKNKNIVPKIEKVEPVKKLQPVMDSFKYEIDPDDDDDDDTLSVYDHNQDLSMYSRSQSYYRSKSSYKPSPKNSIDSFSAHEMSNDNSQNSSMDDYSSKSNDNFLESVINEIKQGDMSDETSQDKKFLVEYELSPEKLSDSAMCGTPEKSEKCYRKSGSITPELDDSYYGSQRSDFSESGFISTESGYKSTESGYKSNDSYRMSEVMGGDFDYYTTEKMSKATIDSLETWSFVLKICQPLLFRHDNSRCYRSTMTNPKLWYTENPKICNCVKDRAIVYDELETCKMSLVDRVYGCDQLFDTPCLKSRTWYSRINLCLIESVSNLTSNWETDDSSQNSELPATSNKSYGARNEMFDMYGDEVALDREYKKFMEAVLPDSDYKKGKNVVESYRSNTPTKSERELELKTRKIINSISNEKTAENFGEEVKRKRKKIRKESSDDWSEDSDVQRSRSRKGAKLEKKRKKKRKKDSSSSDSDDSYTDEDVKKHKTSKKKDNKYRSKTERKKHLEKKRSHKKDKGKKRQKKLKDIEEEDDTDSEEDIKKERSKEKRKIKKKAVKRKKRKQRKKRARTKSTSTSESSSTSSSGTSSESSSDSSSSSSESESEKENIRNIKRKEKAERYKRKRKFVSVAEPEEFDENILNNIKKERLTDDEKTQSKTSDIQDFSPRRQTTSVPRHEIINMKELHNDIVASNLIHIKQEIIEEELDIPIPPEPVSLVSSDPEPPKVDEPKLNTDNLEATKEDTVAQLQKCQQNQNVSPVERIMIEKPQQESVAVHESLKEVTAEGNNETNILNDNSYPQMSSVIYPEVQDYAGDSKIHAIAEENMYAYEQCYRQYDQMDYQQQSDIHLQMAVGESRPIETLVSAGGCRGEIKCDWRPGQRAPRTPPARPSRWGLKPNDTNIVLSGGTTHDESMVYPIRSILDSEAVDSQTYRIETISTTRLGEKTTSPVLGYDEAYEDTYGAADRLAYGDCFGDAGPAPSPAAAPNAGAAPSQPPPAPKAAARASRSLDARIDRALRETVLGLVTKEAAAESESDPQPGPEKGILANRSGARAGKRVSFADGYAPGQDSDAEPPPKKKKTRLRVRGCAWPCPATHPDHVPLWDALPPPDPPPGSPPPHAPAPARTTYFFTRCGPAGALPALKVA